MRSLKVIYPAQVVTGDPAFPEGRPRNVLVLNDGTGTPLEEKWLQDHTGFLQALLVKAGMAPNGVAEGVNQSQLLNALLYLTRNIAGNVNIDGELHTGDDISCDSQVSALKMLSGIGGFESFGIALFHFAAQFISPITANGVTVGPTNPLIAIRNGANFAPSGSTIGNGDDVVDIGLQSAVRQPMRMTGVGHIVSRIAFMPDANSAVSLATADRVIIPATVLTPRTYNFLEDGAQEAGTEIQVINWSSQTHTLQSGGTVIGAIAPVGPSSTTFDWRPSRVDLLYHSNGIVTRWLPTQRHVGT